MKEGVIQQFDTPDRIYHFPANLFVADFIGNPKVNLLDGTVVGKDLIDIGNFKIEVENLRATGKVVLGIRPEDISISTTAVPGGVESIAYSVLPAGADSTIVARKGEDEFTIRVMGISQIKMDQKIWLTFDKSTINVYNKESGNLVN